MLYLLAGIGLVALLVLVIVLEQRDFRTEEYEVSLPLEAPCRECVPERILVLADLHNRFYGEANRRLLDAVKEASPDLILIPGDLIVRTDEDNVHAAALLSNLSQLGIPIYYSLGNHEYRMRNERPDLYEAYLARFADAGVHLLDNESIEAFPGVCVVGLSIPDGCYNKGHKTEQLHLTDVEQLLGTWNRDRFLIMLAHNPVYFEEYAAYGANLIVSGHMHGGIVRLPWIGGVISPQWRLFPKYDAGIFETDKSLMAVSRGLGVHTLPIRLFNKPELMVLKVRK